VKLVFVNRFFHPDLSATSQLLTDLAQYLARAGHDVHVVTSRQRYDDHRDRLRAEETVEGVRVHRVWTSRFGRGTLAGRAVDYLTFHAMAGLRLTGLASRGDQVIAMTDPPLLSVVAAWAARRRGAMLVNWLQDVFPEVAERLELGFARSAWCGLARRLRDGSVRRARLNVVLSEAMARSIEALRDVGPTVRVIPNWSDGARVKPVPAEANALRAEWGLDDRFVVGYSGNMGRAHEFATIVDAIERLRDEPEIAFLFVGGGQQAGWLRGEVERRRWGPRVVFRPYQPRERLAESLSVADVHLVSLRPSLEGLIVPSKFYGIAAVARPTLYIGDPGGEIAGILREGECGASLPPGDSEGVAEAIRRLHRDPVLRARMGANARRVFEARFDRPRAMAAWRAALSESRPASAVD
jgi:colanic acid biosynthesis glycosyl transferase WcaI